MCVCVIVCRFWLVPTTDIPCCNGSPTASASSGSITNQSRTQLPYLPRGFCVVSPWGRTAGAGYQVPAGGTFPLVPSAEVTSAMFGCDKL